jgi:nucleoside-diphosphate-sugar epimerase
MTFPAAYDGVMKGASAVVHLTTIVTFDSDPNEVIPPTIEGAMTALRAAAREKSVVRFVYISSSTAATDPKPNQRFNIDAQTWNDEAVAAAWKPPPYEDSRAWSVYAAIKVEAERALWKFIDEEKPD